MTTPRQQFRALVERRQLVLVPQCLDPLTARIAQAAGFPATYLGGHVVATMHYGLPDHGLVSMAEMVEVASRITDGLNIPLICDADQAGETILNVHRTIKAYERAGVAAVHIEDTRNPKHMASVDAKLSAASGSPKTKASAHDSLDSLVPVPDMQARIATAVAARTDPDFIVIARSDVLFNGGEVSEAIERGQAYAEAGADMYMPIWMKPAQIDEIAGSVPIPLVDISQARRLVQNSHLTLDIFTRFFLRAAAYHYRQHLQELMEAGEFVNERDRTMSGDQLDALTDNDIYLSLASRWANR